MNQRVLSTLWDINSNTRGRSVHKRNTMRNLEACHVECGLYHGYSTFTKLSQNCSDPHLKLRPIAIFAFYFLNYSLAARLQDNSRPKSPTKVETKRKLQQFTVSGWLIMNGGESGNEKIRKLKGEITFNMKRQYSY